MKAAHGKVKLTREHMVYSAESDKGTAPYRVDLLAENGLGKCDCKNFQCTVTRSRRNGEQAFCKHIVRAYTHFGYTQARAIAKQYATNRRQKGMSEA